MLEREGYLVYCSSQAAVTLWALFIFFPPFKNKDILLHNHSTINKFRKHNIDTILLSSVQSIFKFHELP